MTALLQAKTVVLSAVSDAHIAYVQKHLQNKLLIIDPQEVQKGTELSFAYSRGKKVLATYGGHILSGVKSVWYRKPNAIVAPDLPGAEAFIQYAHESIRTHVQDLRAYFKDAFWVSDFYAMQRAESKPFQLEMAAEVGFNIPATVSTSNAQVASTFITGHKAVIVKSLSSYSPSVEGTLLFFPATKITSREPIDLSGLHMAPAIFQQAIEAVADVRVTVVGAQIFAAIVHDKSNAKYTHIRDWRAAHAAGHTVFETYILPKDLQNKCVNLVKKMQLAYGAIDLVLDKDNKLWFLEINPNGQWAFIEQDTGLQIGKAIARLLDKA